MPQGILRQTRNPLSIYDYLAVLAGGLFAVPLVLILALPFIADF